MPGNCGDLYISNYAYETYAKFGKKVLRMQSDQAECSENGVYQVTNTLPAGQYTFSAYLRVLFAFSGTDAGAFIRVVDTAGNVLGVSERLDKNDAKYTRLIVPFELDTAQSVQVQILVNGKGTIYADAAQLENNPYASRPFFVLKICFSTLTLVVVVNLYNKETIEKGGDIGDIKYQKKNRSRKL